MKLFKRGFMISLLVVPILMLACSPTKTDVSVDIPPYATKEPLGQPKLFGEGVISTALPEFATSFSPQGETVYYNVLSADRSVLKIVKSTYRNGAWSDSEAVPFSDGSYRDVDPFVTHDGQRLYFSSDRPVASDESKTDFDTWYVERKGDGWSDPINPGAPLNGADSEVFVSLARTGALYFSASVGEVRRIFRSSVNNGTFAAPEAISFNIPDSVSVGNPMIAPDESYLILTSRMLPGSGEVDLFVVARLDDGSWGEIRNLGSHINSSYTDFAPGISPDGQYLFFTSERPGVIGAVSAGRPPGDLYQVSVRAFLP